MVQCIQNVKEESETVAEAVVHVEISQRQNRGPQESVRNGSNK